jgi:hypothetical protein
MKTTGVLLILCGVLASIYFLGKVGQSLDPRKSDLFDARGALPAEATEERVGREQALTGLGVGAACMAAGCWLTLGSDTARRGRRRR